MVCPLCEGRESHGAQAFYCIFNIHDNKVELELEQQLQLDHLVQKWEHVFSRHEGDCGALM